MLKEFETNECRNKLLYLKCKEQEKRGRTRKRWRDNVDEELNTRRNENREESVGDHQEWRKNVLMG